MKLALPIKPNALPDAPPMLRFVNCSESSEKGNGYERQNSVKLPFANERRLGADFVRMRIFGEVLNNTGMTAAEREFSRSASSSANSSANSARKKAKGEQRSVTITTAFALEIVSSPNLFGMVLKL